MGFDISQPAITEAIYRTILAAYTESPASGLPSASADDQVFLAYAWPGTILEETDYRNPWSPDNPEGHQLATENLSTLVNPIPLLTRAYTQSGNLVEQAYQLILMASPVANAAKAAAGLEPRVAVAAPEAADGSGGRLRSVARKIADHTKGSLAIRDLERAYADAAANLIAHRLQFDLSDPAGSKAWQTVAPNFEASARAAWTRLRQAKAGRDGASTSGSPVASVLSTANQVFSTTTLASVMQAGASYHPSYVSPANFADPDSVTDWPDVPSITVTTPDPAQPSVKISFRFCRVDIRRPWLYMSLLQMQGWRIEGQSAGSLSTGEATDNRGSFPLLPEHLVVARNLTITGTGDQVLYSAKGLQILAWINRVTPFMPPSA